MTEFHRLDHEIARLHELIAQLTADRDLLAAQRAAETEAADRLHRALAQVKSALKRYGQHEWRCTYKPLEVPCSCGFLDALGIQP